MDLTHLLQPLPPPSLTDVVRAAGSRDFGPMIGAYAHRVCGVHACGVARMMGASASAVGLGIPVPDPDNLAVPRMWRYLYEEKYWQRDEAVQALFEGNPFEEVDAQPVRQRGSEMTYRRLRAEIYPTMVDRLLFRQYRPDGSMLVMELSRWDESAEFDAQDLAAARAAAPMLMAGAVLHRRLLSAQRLPYQALGSLAEVERCLADMTHLPQRERQVAACSVLGLPSRHVADRLGIGLESVKSYRKRVYLRLQVNSERELLLKYFALRAAWRELADGELPRDPAEMALLSLGLG